MRGHVGGATFLYLSLSLLLRSLCPNMNSRVCNIHKAFSRSWQTTKTDRSCGFHGRFDLGLFQSNNISIGRYVEVSLDKVISWDEVIFITMFRWVWLHPRK